MTNVFFYPTYNKDEGNLRLSFGTCNFSYIHESQRLPLEVEENGDTFHTLKDQRVDWSLDEDTLVIEREVTIYGCSCIYEGGNTPLVCSGAEIGVAVVWTSAESNRRGVFNLGTLDKYSYKNTFCLHGELFQLRGIVEFTTILYLKKSGTPKSNENHFANIEGTVLGELDKYIIKLDGTGSMFPIYIENNPGAPLWNVSSNWDDPSYDLFSESVRINLNCAHKQYKFIDKDDKNFIPHLLAEIIASALAVVVEELRMEDKSFNCFTDFREGSVAAAIYYFSNTLEIELSSPSRTSLSLRSYLESRIKYLK